MKFIREIHFKIFYSNYVRIQDVKVQKAVAFTTEALASSHDFFTQVNPEMRQTFAAFTKSVVPAASQLMDRG